eukprot:TRINITY_DN13353_c1_g1_i1.p2 TRINITY_DN13353_c1_g1~~TRINITY_DN13353_c1_g1_i1.p2  ORF type:complete len:397 (+),score=123.14 TRINITY_DN13353_c1_g1_i1:76-1191(+)
MDPPFEVRLGDEAARAVAGRIDAAEGQDFADELECSICTHPAFECPVETTPCSHMFHRDCLEQWLADRVGDARCCPDCREELPPGADAYKEVDRRLKGVLNKTQVCCPQSCEPNPKRMRYDELSAHIALCPLTPLACGNADCGVVLPRREMEGDHAAACEHAIVACGQCGEQIKRSALQEHEAAQCTHRLVSCEYCQQADIVFCQKMNHELECPGHVPVRVLAELKTAQHVLQAAHDISKAAYEAERDAARATQERADQLLGVLGTLLDVPLRVRVHAALGNSLDGEYTILPEKENGCFAWGKPDGAFLFKTPRGAWSLAANRSEMERNKGRQRSSRTDDPDPVFSSRWKYWDGIDWVPSPYTSIEPLPPL